MDLYTNREPIINKDAKSFGRKKKKTHSFQQNDVQTAGYPYAKNINELGSTLYTIQKNQTKIDYRPD